MTPESLAGQILGAILTIIGFAIIWRVASHKAYKAGWKAGRNNARRTWFDKRNDK